MLYLQIAIRTFAQVVLAGILALQGLDWGDVGNVEANAFSIGLVVAAGLLAGVIAAGTAYARSPAATTLGKAVRSFVQAVVGGLGAVVINEGTDWVDTGHLVVGLLGTAVLAFVVTYLQYLAAEPVLATPADDGR